MKRVIWGLTLFSALGAAQTPDPGAHVEAMKKFAFLAGDWKGEGWVEMAPGQRHEYEQTERVEFRQRGTIISIVGQGKDKATGELGHDAFAVLSFDPAKGQYTMTSWAYPGRRGSFEIKPEGEGFAWGMKNGPATIRYRMKLSAEGVWHETGEMTVDGQTWRQFLEFKVRRVK
jgi:hypothetical protein